MSTGDTGEGRGELTTPGAAGWAGVKWNDAVLAATDEAADMARGCTLADATVCLEESVASSRPCVRPGRGERAVSKGRVDAGEVQNAGAG